MKNTIIKGNGKSRIIKAPEDMPETYIEWRNQAIRGRTFFDIGLNTEVENENSGCDVIGTPLNKTTLLSDKTKSSLQLEGEDPTVNDALYKLSSMRAQPNGIATLNGNGKLAQMPAAADVGALPASAISSGSDVNGSAWIELPGGIQICTGAMRWENIGITTAISSGSGYVSQKLKFPNYAREFPYAPRCAISLAVSTDLGVVLQADDEGPRTTMPQIFRLRAPTSTTVSSVTVHYIAVGVSS